MNTRPGARLAWCWCGLTVALLAAGIVLVAVDPGAGGPSNPSAAGPSLGDETASGGAVFSLFVASLFTAFAAAGAVMAARRPRNPVGWLFCAAGFFMAVTTLADATYWHAAFGEPGPHPTAELALWVENWSWIPALVALFTLFPLLFPTGAPPSPRWRFLVWTAAGAGTITLLATAFTPGPLQGFGWVENPIAIRGLGLGTVAEVSFVVGLAAALAGMASLVVRYRRSHGIERQQLKWVTAGGSLMLLGAVTAAVVTATVSELAGFACLLVGFVCLAAAVVVAMLRYRLYDLDVVINRALVYGALTATLAAAYVAIVLLLQLVLSPSSDLAVAASTLAVAALSRPARGRIQGAVDRRFYRRRYDAARILERFGARLRDQVELDALAVDLRDVVVETVHPAHVSLWLREAR